jgi:hypothetical protein
VEEAAQDAEGDTSAVEQLITRGIELRKAGDDEAALTQFRQAEQLQPESARIRVHLAATYQALGDWEAADRYLTLASSDPSDSYVQTHRSILDRARRTIDTHIGRLQISGGPPGTQIWLNGRAIGALPLPETLRIQAGVYTLDARLSGYYAVTRRIVLPGGALVRESIQLAGENLPETPEPAVVVDSGPTRGSSGTPWLAWTFAGLTVGAGTATVLAWTARERHVEHWNDDNQCLKPGLTRGQACAAEHAAGDRAETWTWVGGAATGAFAAASLVSYWLHRRAGSRQAEAELRCGFAPAGALCTGHF